MSQNQSTNTPTPVVEHCPDQHTGLSHDLPVELLTIGGEWS